MKTFRSKFGYEIIAFISIIYAIAVTFMYFKNEASEAILSVSVVFIAVYVICFYLILATKYTITNDDKLHITCGILYNKKYDIHYITSVVKSNNLISSPAPSLDRIELKYGKYDLIVISPKSKITFIEELLKINPNIENRVF
jgi:hypothetical protein